MFLLYQNIVLTELWIISFVSLPLDPHPIPKCQHLPISCHFFPFTRDFPQNYSWKPGIKELITSFRGSLYEHKVVSRWFGSQNTEYDVKLNIPMLYYDEQMIN